jgi:hypothetical protein
LTFVPLSATNFNHPGGGAEGGYARAARFER